MTNKINDGSAGAGAGIGGKVMQNKINASVEICYLPSPFWKETPPPVHFEMELNAPESDSLTQEDIDCCIIEDVFNMIGGYGLYVVVNIKIGERYLDTTGF